MLLIQNLLNRQELDDSTRSLVERRTLALGIGRIAETDEEASWAVFAFHDGFEGVDVGAADLVHLCDIGLSSHLMSNTPPGTRHCLLKLPICLLG